jgi:hypothetical protein
MDMLRIWKGTPLGEKLKNVPPESYLSKLKLAQKTIDFLKTRQDITTLLLGTGSTVYQIADLMFSPNHNPHITTVFTNNTLVFCAFLRHKPLGIVLRTAGGKLELQIASLTGRDAVESFRRQEVNAVITSFTALSEKWGFTTEQDYEIEEKLMNLYPHEKCHTVLIPLEWTKINAAGGFSVTERSGLGPFDFKSQKREYIIITNPPEKEDRAKGDDKERFDLLNRLEGQQVFRVIYEY